MAETKPTIAQRLKELRGEMTQREVAEAAGVTVLTVSNIERGKVSDPHMHTVSKIAEALGVEVGTLLR